MFALPNVAHEKLDPVHFLSVYQCIIAIVVGRVGPHLAVPSRVRTSPLDVQA